MHRMVRRAVLVKKPAGKQGSSRELPGDLVGHYRGTVPFLAIGV
jgi:hypothetical protein